MCFATTIDEDIDDDIWNDIAQNVGLWTKLLSTMMVFSIFNFHSSVFTLCLYLVSIAQIVQKYWLLSRPVIMI